MKNDVTKCTNTNKFFEIFKAVIFAYIITFILLFVYSLALAYTDLSDTTISMFVTGITIFSIFLTTVIHCRKLATQGIVNGGIISFIYLAILYILGSVFLSSFTLNTQSILLIISVLLVGMIGGILGVNFNKLQR